MQFYVFCSVVQRDFPKGANPHFFCGWESRPLELHISDGGGVWYIMHHKIEKMEQGKHLVCIGICYSMESRLGKWMLKLVFC